MVSYCPLDIHVDHLAARAARTEDPADLARSIAALLETRSARHGAMAAAHRLPGSWDDNKLYPMLIAELVAGH